MFWGAAGLVLISSADAQDVSQAPSDSGIVGAPAPLQVQAPSLGGPRRLSGDDQSELRQAVSAAGAGDMERAKSLQASLSDPVARKIVLWEMIDSAPERLSFFELDQARRDLWGWPHATRRQAAAEKQLESQSMPPQAVIDWFKGQDPVSAEGAIALAAADRAAGRADDAAKLIKHFWRDVSFEAEPQRQMLARFSDLLTPDDHVARADMLLYGQQGPAARDIIALLPPDQQVLARIRIAFREGDPHAELMMEQLPPSLQDSPGLAFERARSFRRQKETTLALSLVKLLPKVPPSDDAGSAIWVERRALIGAALAARDYQTAYQAAADNGLHPGSDFAEAEFYAGWIALTKLHKPELAEPHFANLQQVGSSPITQARALYWRGRAEQAEGDGIGASTFYAQAAQYTTTFYGQLAAERAGLTQIDIGRDPAPTAADHARFDGRETVQAARFLADAGVHDLYRTFVLATADTLPNAEESALLVDLARNNGDQDLSMRAARVAAQHGFILPERGYPVMTPGGSGGAEAALVLSITRQESNFDPGAHSGPGARGMMQLMPGTARILARRLGEPYSPDRLYNAEYNMRLGAAYLGDMINSFGGSYVMAAASYNAGPNHMPDWTAACGDPRTSSGDPVDFIECIPFSETRNYVMRIMETTQVYRARLNGGRAPLTLTSDLKRGGYSSRAQTPMVALGNAPPSSTATPSSAVVTSGSGAMAPIPD
jgi:soluble lytic murein transglycosylase